MPIRILAVVVALLVLAGGAGAQTMTPPAVDGSGLDILGWAVETFGYPGIAVWIAWQLRGYLAAAKSWNGVPIQLTGPIVIELHPNTMSKFVPRPPKPPPPESDSENDSPQPASSRTRRVEKWEKP